MFVSGGCISKRLLKGDAIAHLRGLFSGKLYFFRSSAKTSDAGRPFPALAESNAFNVFASSAASSIS